MKKRVFKNETYTTILTTIIFIVFIVIIVIISNPSFKSNLPNIKKKDYTYESINNVDLKLKELDFLITKDNDSYYYNDLYNVQYKENELVIDKRQYIDNIKEYNSENDLSLISKLTGEEKLLELTDTFNNIIRNVNRITINIYNYSFTITCNSNSIKYNVKKIKRDKNDNIIISNISMYEANKNKDELLYNLMMDYDKEHFYYYDYLNNHFSDDSNNIVAFYYQYNNNLFYNNFQRDYLYDLYQANYNKDKKNYVALVVDSDYFKNNKLQILSKDLNYFNSKLNYNLSLSEKNLKKLNKKLSNNRSFTLKIDDNFKIGINYFDRKYSIIYYIK